MSNKNKSCNCTKIPNWTTKVDRYNRPIVCLKGQSMFVDTTPPKYDGWPSDPILITPDPRCPKCKKICYKCVTHKCANKWGWARGVYLEAGYTFGNNIQICRWPNGEERAPIIIGWHKEGECAHAIFACGDPLEQPFEIKNNEWVYNDGRRSKTGQFHRFRNNLGSSTETVENFNIPIVKFSKHIVYRRPSEKLRAPPAMVEQAIRAKPPMECISRVCGSNLSFLPPAGRPDQGITNGIYNPCRRECNNPNSNLPGCNSWAWLEEYGARGIPYQCKEAGYDQISQHVYYVYAQYRINI